MRKTLSISLALTLAAAVPAMAQSTGTPSYNAPYRAFVQHEFGGTLSFSENDVTGVEGQYRFGQGTWDVGLRGGFVDAAGATSVIFGASGRVRVLTHSEQFPFDGAFIVGGGTQEFDNLNVPLGLSLGRRLDLQGSNVSIVPYAQPTLFMVFDDNALTDTINVAFGFGADFRLSALFDLRVSVSLGDVEGIAFSAVWVR
ncbi:MAG: hypothetical protein PVF27_04890 [Gemmatimonadales bacterium]|jgi:hypothetical protein